jgi:hypothetical protein
MNVRFHDMQPANACAKTLVGVISAYGSQPSFNPSATDVAVLSQDESGAEFPAGRKTKIGKPARSAAAKSTEPSSGSGGRIRTDGSSAWIVRAAGQGSSALVLERICTRPT